MKPCRHSRWTVVKRAAHADHCENGEPHPDPRRRFRVLEVLRCVNCNTAGTRWSRFYGATARSALKRAGVPEDQLPPPPNHKEKALAVPALTCWPFPVTGHDWSKDSACTPGRRDC